MTKKRVTDVLDWMELILVDGMSIGEEDYSEQLDFTLEVLKRARFSLDLAR